MLSIIVAISQNNVIGNKGAIPWYLSTDLKRFARLTKGHTVIMGRKTYESIVARLGKPLPDRKNIVLTSQSDFEAPGCIVCNSFEQAVLESIGDGEVFVIGGEALYKEALPRCDKMYITTVNIETEGNAFFPEWNAEEAKRWKMLYEAGEDVPAGEKDQYASTFMVYERKK